MASVNFPAEYLCAKCNQLLENPLQSRCCGKRLCKSCVDEIISKNLSCPCCEAKEIFTCFTDKAAKNQIESYTMHCVYKNCDWSGSRLVHKEHLGNCRHKPARCSGCNVEFSKTNILIHKIICLELLKYSETCFKHNKIGIQEVGGVPIMNGFCEKYRSFRSLLSDPAATVFSGMHSDLVSLARSSISFLHPSSQQSTTLVSLIKDLPQDGSCGWKVSHFSSRMAEARRDEVTSLYSLPFYTSPNGYKMCLRLDPNGSDDGKNSHLSLFIVILPSDHNFPLVVPFRVKASFTLVNMNSGEDITTTITPGPFDSFSSNDTEVKCGFNMFVSQEIALRDFVYRDMIFVKCDVTMV